MQRICVVIVCDGIMSAPNQKIMKETKSNYCEHCGEFHDAVRDYTSMVKVGETVPDFEFETYHTGAITTMSISQLRGKWVVLVFYPADFTFICPTELEELAKLYPKFQALNAEIISVSSDTVFTHKAWHDTSDGIKEIKYPMAADPSGKLAHAFGVLIEGAKRRSHRTKGSPFAAPSLLTLPVFCALWKSMTIQ